MNSFTKFGAYALVALSCANFAQASKEGFDLFSDKLSTGWEAIQKNNTYKTLFTLGAASAIFGASNYATQQGRKGDLVKLGAAAFALGGIKAINPQTSLSNNLKRLALLGTIHFTVNNQTAAKIVGRLPGFGKYLTDFEAKDYNPDGTLTDAAVERNSGVGRLGRSIISYKLAEVAAQASGFITD